MSKLQMKKHVQINWDNMEMVSVYICTSALLLRDCVWEQCKLGEVVMNPMNLRFAVVGYSTNSFSVLGCYDLFSIGDDI